MKRRHLVAGLIASISLEWPRLGAAQVSPRPLIPVWMGEDMARRLIELIGRHEDPEDRKAMIAVFEHALSGANQPPRPIPPDAPS